MIEQIIWLASAFLLVLLILEIGLRAITLLGDFLAGRQINIITAPESWNPPPAMAHRLLYKTHPFIGWVTRPNIRTTWHDGKNWNIMGTNNHGFIGSKDTTLEKPAGRLRIICVGGSTTEENTGDDYNLSYPHRLEEALKESLGNSVEVLNGGVAAYTTAENMLNLQLRLFEFSPDVIIFYHGINDAWVGSLADFKADYSHCRKNDGVEPNFWNKLPTLKQSFAYSYIRSSLIERYGKSHWLVPNISEWPPRPAKEFNPQAVAVFKRNLKNMVNLALANGTAPVIVKMNYHPRIDDGALSLTAKVLGLDKDYDEIFKRTLRENIAASKEIADEVDGAIYIETGDIDKDDFRDDWHFTTEGKKLFAEAIAKQITPILKERFKL